MLPLSVPEIRHLLGRLLYAPPREPAHYLFWSVWRRTHQAIARFWHYQKRRKAFANAQRE